MSSLALCNFFYPINVHVTGILSWEIDLAICDLNKELTLFETKHSAQFSSEVKGQFCKVLERFSLTDKIITYNKQYGVLFYVKKHFYLLKYLNNLKL